MHRGAAEAPFPHRHLLGIEGLSPDDINHVLDLADGYVELNRQAEKKRTTSRQKPSSARGVCAILERAIRSAMAGSFE